MNVPLVLGDRVYGLLTVNSAEVRAFGERDLRVVGELARHAASALQNALQFEQERHRRDPPAGADRRGAPGARRALGLAALYQAAAGSQVGGDFYSAAPRRRAAGPAGGRRVGQGRRGGRHDRHGAVVHGRGAQPAPLRAGGRRIGAQRAPACAPPDGGLVTLVLAVLDTGAGTLAWCSAGHRRRCWWTRPEGRPCSRTRGRRAAPSRGPPSRGTRSPSHGRRAGALPDGILEARRDGREFGEEGLSEVLRDALGEAPSTSPARSTGPPAPGPGAGSPTTSPSRWRGGSRQRDDAAVRGGYGCAGRRQGGAGVALIGEANRRWWVLVAMTGSLSMILLDQTIVSVALPSIQRTSTSRRPRSSG